MNILVNRLKLSSISGKNYQVCLTIIYNIFIVRRIPNIWCWSNNILRGCKVMCYQVCVVLVQECLRLKKRKFKHTVQWVSLKTFSLIFILLHSPFFLLFFQDWMLHMEIPSTCILTPFFNYQSNVLRQYTKKQRNVFTCYGSLKRTKEKTNIENNEKILLVFIITIVLCIVLMSLLLIADVSSSLLFIW